jgi:Kef-type K+ transport system membrane component KefB
VGIGLNLDFQAVAQEDTLLLTVIIVIAAVASKLAGSSLGAIHLGRTDMLRIGIGMIPRGEVGMVVAQIGLALHVIEKSVYAIVVFMAIATTMIAPPLLNLAFKGAYPSAEPTQLEMDEDLKIG